jgi:sugar phosphate isomerase/epimerase
MSDRELNGREITRRTFLRDVAALSASAAVLNSCTRNTAVATNGIAPATAEGATKPTVNGIGLQLYTVGDQMRADFDGTIEKVAQIGYRQVEFAGYQNKSPDQVRALLDRLSLKSPSTHIGMDALRKDLDAQIRIAQTIGHEYITIPSLGRSETPMNTVDAWKRVADECNTMGARLKSHGLKLAFHSHTGEYVQVGGGKTGMDVFVSETDPAVFNFQMDLGWARVAGQNPVSWFRKYPGRFKMWHVKDIEELKIAQEREAKILLAAASDAPRVSVPSAQSAPPAGTRQQAGGMPVPQPGRPAPVGLGDIDFAPILAAWKESGMQYFFVEQDGAAGWPGGSLASCATSYVNLRELLT